MARKPSNDKPASEAKPTASSTASSTTASTVSTPPTGTDRENVVAALMTLLAEKPFERIGFNDIADQAGITLAALRDLFPSKLAILAERTKQIDRAVLSGADADMAEEPARERLFDVLMRRFEAMTDDRPALRSLMRSASRDPGLALALNGLAVNSQQWMLSAAGISASGPKGMLRAQGLALLFAKVARVWIHDDDPGFARTMAALDRELATGQRLAGLLDNLLCIPEALCRAGRRRRARRDEADDATIAA
jgi:AcrR family transcriptional regulator